MQLDAKLTKLTQAQVDYIGVPVAEPSKAEDYGKAGYITKRK